MKYVLAIAYVGLISGSLNAAEMVRLDLKDAKEFAIRNNYTLTALRYEIRESEAMQSKSYSAFMPRIGIAGGIESASELGANRQQKIAYAYLNYNLFNGFQDFQLSKLARIEVEQLTQRLLSAEFELGLDVEEQFDRFIFVNMRLELKKHEIAANDKHLAYVKQARDRGSVADTDLMEFQLAEALLKSELVALEQDLEESRSAIKLLLGEEIGKTLQPVGQLPHQHLTAKLDDLVSNLQLSQKEIKLAALAVRRAQTEQNLSRSSLMPTVDIEAQSGFLANATEQDKNQSRRAVLLIAKLELFSGGRSRWEMAAKDEARQKEDMTLKQSITTALRNAETYYRRLKAIEARADLERENANFAQRYYVSALNEYKRGAKNSSDLKSASGQAFATMVRQIELDYEFVSQRLKLERLLGHAVDVVNVSTPTSEKKGDK